MSPAAKEQLQAWAEFCGMPSKRKDAQDARGYGTAQGERILFAKAARLLGPDAVAAKT